MKNKYIISGKETISFDTNSQKLDIQGSLTGIVWLPFQAKYEHLYKYVRFRPPELSTPEWSLVPLS